MNHINHMLVSTSFKPRVQRGAWKTENNKKVSTRMELV